MRFPRILISVLALATVAAPSWATTVEYCSSCGVGDDQTAFNTATQSVYFQNIAFTTANLSSSGYSDPSGVIITDYVSNNSDLSVTGGNLADTNSWGFAAALPNVVYDFWFTVTAPAFSSITVGFTAPDGGYNNSFTVGSSGVFFFGVSSTAPITNLSFHNSATHTDTLTAFDFAEPAQTPEAATLLLIGSGLIAMRFFKKRDRSSGRQQLERPAVAAGYISPQIAAS